MTEAPKPKQLWDSCSMCHESLPDDQLTTHDNKHNQTVFICVECANARAVCAACIEAAESDLGSVDYADEPRPPIAAPEDCTAADHDV
jgi:hypothetical protein